MWEPGFVVSSCTRETRTEIVCHTIKSRELSSLRLIISFCVLYLIIYLLSCHTSHRKCAIFFFVPNFVDFWVLHFRNSNIQTKQTAITVSLPDPTNPSADRTRSVHVFAIWSSCFVFFSFSPKTKILPFSNWNYDFRLHNFVLLRAKKMKRFSFYDSHFIWARKTEPFSFYSGK